MLSLTLAQGAGQGNLGIYVKSIVKGGPAEMVRSNRFLIVKINLSGIIHGKIETMDKIPCDSSLCRMAD